MKLPILSLMSYVAVAMAQAVPNFPPCGSGTMLPAISATNCGFTDSICLCKNQSFRETLMTKIPKVCPAAADVQFYAKFINDQCVGQPGYPISIGISVRAEPASSSTSGAGLAAASASASPANPVSSIHNDNSGTPSGTAKPATFTGSAASRGMERELFTCSVAIAVFLALLMM